MKYVKYSFLFALIIFSFYLSDKVLLYVETLNPIMQTIYEVEDKYEIQSVDAIIDGNTIIPGKNGRVVNERESYLKMKEFKTFNDTFLVYKYIKPNISLLDNLDKIIINGNKESVSLVVNNKNIENYLNDLNINYNKIIYNKEEIVSKKIEYIDGNSNLKLNLKNKICILGISNIGMCKKNKYFIIQPSLNIQNNNLYLINKITKGNIIFIDGNLTLTNFKVLYNKIKSRNLDIIKISENISE